MDILRSGLLKDGMMVWDELKKSSVSSGDYLLFTSVNGIADDAGWEYVKVRHHEQTIGWVILRDDIEMSYVFAAADYIQEINRLSEDLKNMEPGFTLEPSHVIFPE